MENQNQNSLSIEGDPATMTTGSGIHEAPPDPNALSFEPESLGLPISQAQSSRQRENRFLQFVRRKEVILALFLVAGGIATIFLIIRGQNQGQSSNNNSKTSLSSQYETVRLPLDELDLITGVPGFSGSTSVTINGDLQVGQAFGLTPSVQPTGARAGQIYYDSSNNQLAYYNGEVFVFLTSPEAETGGVQSLGGATGQLTLGGGLSLAGGSLRNAGVLSILGQTGNVSLTAGPGIVLNGTNFSNSGVISVTAGTPNVTVTNDGSGNVTLSVASSGGGGTGTVTSSGGTNGRIPLFTASQNIENSIISQSGLTVTISGDLSVVTGGLTLSNALTVSNGGTGANSLATNGVLVGNGTAAISSVTAGGSGLCLLSTAGAPAWSVCPSAAAVTSLNGLTGGLSIANASGAGSTITIDDASTTNKGIASFDSTNFTAAGGAVNTIQNINSGATPTFAGVNTNTITPNAALTVGISAQTALLQGSTTTITSSGAGNNIVLNSAATIELQDNTNVAGNLAASGDIAVNGGDITSTGALNITPGGALTIGATSQALTLQGGATTSFSATSGANTTVVAFTSPTADTTLNFPALAAGTYTICTTSGNCSGAATTLQGAYDNSTNPEITLDATRGALTLRDNATPLGANLLEVQNNAGSITYLAVTASGAAVTGAATVSGNVNSTTGSLQTNSTNRIDNAGNLVNIGTLSLSGAISGGTTITGSGNINSTAGAIQTNGTTRIDNAGNLVNIAAVTASGNATFQGGVATLGTNAQAGSVVLHDGSSNTGTLQVAALGQDTVYTLPDPGAGTATICLTTGNCAGTGGGVTTGGGTTNRLAKFTAAGAIGDSTISDDGTNVTVSVDAIIQGGDLTLGTAAQPGSLLLHDSNGQTTTMQAGNSTGNLTFVLPTNTGVANQCLKQSGVGNQLVWQDCDGGAGGTSATLQTAYNNSVDPEITLNSSIGGVSIRDNSTPIGSALFNIQNNAGTTTYLAVTVSGISVDGAATVSGNVNATTGTLQTNSTTRIDNSGNLVSIGNITGSGPITISSIGAGSDITIDGTDQFIVQDASVFNALSTFNANIDLGANDLVGTTADINLTNFDVAGATGNVTAGTYNGQTISNAANFTGTVAIAGNTTLTGDIAVNGGDITSAGALTITPGGILTVGAAGQQLILQGNASTQVTATGGGFTTTVGFTGTPAGAVAYNFDRAAAAGTYNICTSVGNCAGTGGGVTTTGGTIGTLPKFTGAQTLGDSLLSESGTVVTVNGNLNLTAGNEFRVNGTQISSANLSNDANLAKLSASQTFTGNTVAFQNAANSTNAFNIQNQAGGRVLTVDTTGGQVLLGVSSVLDGKLVFSNVSNANTVTILPGTPGGNRTLTLPDASGILCTDSGNCAGAGATLQTSYNFSVGGTTPKIKVNSGLGGVDIQDADTTIGANLLNVRASNAVGLGNVMFGVGNTGEVTLQNATNSTTAFRLLTQGGTAVLTGDTQNGRIALGQSGTLDGSLVFNNAANANTVTITAPTATGARAISFGDESGTVCLRNNANCGFATASGATNYIHNQSASDQSADFRITGTGRANTSFLAPLYDTAGAAALAIGTNNATAINLNQNTVIASGMSLTVGGTLSQSGGTISLASNGSASYTSNGSTTITAGGASTWSTSSGNLTVQAATTSTLNLQTGGAGTVTVGNQNTTTIDIGRGSNIARTIRIGDAGSSTAQTITIGSTGGASGTTIQGGTGDINLISTDTIIARATNSFDVQSGASETLFSVSAANSEVLVAKSGANAVLHILATTGTASPYVRFDTGNSDDWSIGLHDDGNADFKIARGNGFGANEYLTLGAASGAATFRNSSNTATAFQIQDNAGAALITADTTARSVSGGNLVKIGNSTGTDGALTILKLDSSAGAPSTNLAALNGGLFYNSSTNKVSIIENGAVKVLCNTTDLGCGAAGGGGSLQAAYTASTGGTTPEVLLDTTRNGLDIQDANTTIGATIPLFAVRASATASTLGNILFDVQGNGRVGIDLGATTSNVAFDITFGQSANRTIGVANSTSGGGKNLTLLGGEPVAGDVNPGGDVVLQGGYSAGGATITAHGGINGVNNNNAGDVELMGGNSGAVIMVYGTDQALASSDGGGILLQADSGTVTNGVVLVKNLANSTTAFQVQNTAANGWVFNVDTTNNEVELGRANTVSGTLVFASASNGFTTKITSAATASYTLTLPTAVGASGDCLKTSNGTGSLTFGSCAAGGSLQGAYTASTGGTTPEIKLDTTRTTLDIQNADSAITNHLLAVRDSNGSGLGNLLFNVYSSGRVGINMGTNSSNPTFDLTFGNGASRSIGVTGASSGAGNSISIQGGSAASAGFANGSAILSGGGSTGSSFTAGGGTSNANDDVGGNAVMQGGTGGGSVTAYGGAYDAGSGTQDGGSVMLTPGAGASGGFEGAVIVQPVANSTSTFLVRQSNTTTVLRVDTLVPRVTIGAIAQDDTGALLVLDFKSGATDPTGTLGAMYYNNGMGKFRCYENSMWRDCMASARSEYHYTHEMIGTTAEMNGGFYAANSGSFSGSAVAGLTGHPGIVQLSTGTASASGIGGFGTNDTGQSFLLGNGDYYKYETLLRVPTLSTGTQTFTVRGGLLDGTSTDGTDGCFFKYTHGTNSGRWQAICQSNTTQSVCNSTSTVAANTWYRMTIAVNASGTSADFFVNGTNICTVNAQIPTGAGRNVSTNLTITKSVGTGTAGTLDVDYMEILAQFGTLR